jgi:acyl-CoA thioesterase
MLFSELLQSIRVDENSCTLVVPDDWMQGRSVFGGLQAVFGLQAMRTLVPASVPLRTLQVTFIAPVPAGAMHAEARILRTGKSATHVEAQLLDGTQVLASMIGVFGVARASEVARTPEQSRVESSEPQELPFMQGLTPNFTQHFSIRWLRGGIPFTGNPSPQAVIEANMRDTAATSESHVIAMADLIPPVALSMLKTPAAGSSLTWMLEFLADSFEHLSLEKWRIDAEILAARDGYTNQSCMIWGPGGEPLALSRQSMVVFG